MSQHTQDPALRAATIPCPTCSCTGTDTYEDRHTGTNMDTCRTCGGNGYIAARTGETPEASYQPALSATPAHAPGKAGDREGLTEGWSKPGYGTEAHAVKAASRNELASLRASALAPSPTGNEAPRKSKLPGPAEYMAQSAAASEGPAWTAFQVWIAEAKPKVWQEEGFRAGYAAALAQPHAGSATARALSQILAEAPEHEPVDPTPDAEATEGEAYHRDLAWWEAAQIIRAAMAEDGGAPRAAVPAEPDSRAGAEISDAAVAKAIDEDGGWWKSCSGCHETNEGQETGHYPYSELFRCHVGGGCIECGGLGVRWEYYSEEQYAEMEAALHPSPPTASGAVAPVGEDQISKAAHRVFARLCEFDDRTSPEEYPDMVLVTADELSWLMTEELATPTPAPHPVPAKEDR